MRQQSLLSTFFALSFGTCGWLCACQAGDSGTSDEHEEIDTSNDDTGLGQGGQSDHAGTGGTSGEADLAEGGEQAMGGTFSDVGGALSSGQDDEQSHTMSCPSTDVGFAEEVVATNFGAGESFGQGKLPEIVLGPPVGGGCCSGSLDVVSLGNGGSITLGFGERVVIDGPGPDFIVFENAFWAGGDEAAAFIEWGSVAVSADGKTWHEFPCDVDSGLGCAGTQPTFVRAQSPDISPFDPEAAGGDAFDLADLGLDQVSYVKITDLPDDDMGFDLDAVSIVNGQCK